MTMIQPQSHIPQPPSRRDQLKQEWNHFAEMRVWPLCLYAILSAVLLVLSPLLPSIAYLLQRWAGSSWDWRDRWTSIWIWAKQGSGFIAMLLSIVLLGKFQKWNFPELIVRAQFFWQAHLPGTLSLSPLEGSALVARTLLFLPLAPVVSLLYEWIDPRTIVQLQRILTPADLVEPSPPDEPSKGSTTDQATPLPDDAQKQTNTTTSPKAKRPKGKQAQPVQGAQTFSTTEQMVVESALVSNQTQARATSPRPKGAQKAAKKQKAESQRPQAPLVPKPINWDEVLE